MAADGHVPTTGPLSGEEFAEAVDEEINALFTTRVISATVTHIVALTQAAYDALPSKDAATLYVIIPA